MTDNVIEFPKDDEEFYTMEAAFEDIILLSCQEGVSDEEKADLRSMFFLGALALMDNFKTSIKENDGEITEFVEKYDEEINNAVFYSNRTVN